MRDGVFKRFMAGKSCKIHLNIVVPKLHNNAPMGSPGVSVEFQLLGKRKSKYAVFCGKGSFLCVLAHGK